MAHLYTRKLSRLLPFYWALSYFRHELPAGISLPTKLAADRYMALVSVCRSGLQNQIGSSEHRCANLSANFTRRLQLTSSPALHRMILRYIYSLDAIQDDIPGLQEMIFEKKNVQMLRHVATCLLQSLLEISDAPFNMKVSMFCRHDLDWYLIHAK